MPKAEDLTQANRANEILLGMLMTQSSVSGGGEEAPVNTQKATDVNVPATTLIIPRARLKELVLILTDSNNNLLGPLPRKAFHLHRWWNAVLPLLSQP